jgi:hypothetical protein
MRTQSESRRRWLANTLIVGMVVLLLPSCGSVILPTPSTPYYVGVKTIQYTYVDGYPTVITVTSEYLSASVVDDSSATGGFIYSINDGASGGDGFFYLANARAPATWQFTYDSGPCEGLSASNFFNNHQISNFYCLFHTQVIGANGFLPDGTPVYTGGSDQLTPDQSLYPEDMRTSADGRFHFKYQNDGNLVLYDENWSWMWQSGTSGTCAGRTTMQGDGNLVVYDCNNSPVWNSGTAGNSGAGLVVQSDGNVVVYAQDTSALWWTGTNIY